MGRTADSSRVAFWRELIERRRRSSLSVAQLCAEASVSTASFYLWQRKLRKQAASARNHPPARPASSQLVPVRIVPDALAHRDAAGMLEVELPGEIHLRIPAGCDAATLQVVLSLLLKEGGAEASSC
jgi:hypothetical protein